MLNFEYICPTRIVFGRGTIAELDRLVPRDACVMMTYGRGSIKRNGVYDQVVHALDGRRVVEFPGIPPNPTYEVCMQAVEVCRREGVDFLLAVGGGSVLDGTKFIAAAVPWTRGDPWIFLERRGEVLPETALPLGCVLTLPATGSESNAFAVISRESTQEKRAFDSEWLFPKFAILDPTTTFSLPRNQVRNGIVDAFVHVLEQYATYPVNTPLQDRQAEAILTTLTEIALPALNEPDNYDVRANLMWCATMALNRHLSCGTVGDWATHMIGHELTAFYGLAHAESLAVVLPARWRFDIGRKREKLTRYARYVWNYDGPADQTAEFAIRRTEEFFRSLGMPTKLSAWNIDADEAAERVRARFRERGTVLGEHKDLGPDEVAAILRDCG